MVSRRSSKCRSSQTSDSDEEFFMRSYCVSLIEEIFDRTGIKFSQFETLDLYDPNVASDIDLRMLGVKPLCGNEILDLSEGIGSIEAALNIEACKAERVIYSMLSIMMKNKVITFEKFDEANQILWSKSQSEIMAESFGAPRRKEIDHQGEEVFFF